MLVCVLDDFIDISTMLYGIVVGGKISSSIVGVAVVVVPMQETRW